MTHKIVSSTLFTSAEHAKHTTVKRYSLLLILAVIIMATPSLFAAPTVDVEVTGLDTKLRDNVLLILDIEQQNKHESLTDTHIRTLHNKAPSQIKTALQPFGYYKPVIDSKLEKQSDETWRAVYTIDAGSPIPIRQFDFKLVGAAENDSAFTTLIKNLPLAEGKPLNHTLYETIKQDLSTTASERGYFDAKLKENKVTINLESYGANVVLHFDSGQRYQFGDVTFSEPVLRPAIMQRYVPFKKGEPYTIDALLSLQQALIDSDIFNSVEVHTRQKQAQDAIIPIDVTVEPRKRHKYTLGAGYGTDTGARGKIGWEVPRINDRGHRFSSELRVSQIADSIVGKYHIPLKNPRTNELVFQAGYNRDTTDTSESYKRFAGTSLSQARGQWREVWSISFEKERFTIADQRNQSTLLIPGANWTRVWAQDRINSRKGTRFDLTIRGATEQLLSDNDFLQASTAIKTILPLGSNARLITKVLLAGTDAPDFNALPSSLRFFAGGAQSVRGYRYQSLGPQDDNGDVLGGRYLAVASLELEHRIIDKWSAAVFFDTGNAIDALSDPLERGAGLGIRWRSPIGPIRIDFASAISRDNKPWRLHINIGPDL